MSNRVYFTMSEESGRYPQEIGACLISYLDYQLGVHKTINYHTWEGRTELYIICTNEQESRDIYELMASNSNRGVFDRIERRDAYHTNRRFVRERNGNPWHDRFYKAINRTFIHIMEGEINKPITPGTEFTRTVQIMGY